MNKKTLYKKVQALFPSELAVGDVVEYANIRMIYYYTYFIGKIEMVCLKKIGDNYTDTFLKEDVKLIRKNITGEDILKMFNKVRKFHTHLELNNKGYLTYWESSYEDRTKQEDWILGKSLYDQSEDLIKLVLEVLRNE